VSRNYPYLNKELSVEERTADLLSRMTLKEKIAQLGCAFWNSRLPEEQQQLMLSDGIGQISALLFGGMGSSVQEAAQAIAGIQQRLIEQTRLGIPAIIHGEALSGALLPGADNFPLAIGLGAAWNPDSIEAMAEVIRKQFRAVGIAQALSPVLDVGRDPRWGRIGETYGEDPTLISSLGVAFVRGLQGDTLSEGVAATAKHFLGYSMTEGALNMTEEHIPPRTLREVYARPFEAVIRKADLASVMNSYSSLDGEPIISSRAILTDLLRGELGFRGLTVTDYRSIDKLVDSFKTAKDMREAGVQAMKAGMDMELPSTLAYGAPLLEAVEAGDVDREWIDQAVSRVLQMKFMLGLFERPYPDPDRIETAFHQPEDANLSLAVARQSIVLVKNEGDLLPLNPRYKKIAVIGPNARSLRNLFGGYTHPAAKELSFGMARMAGVEISGVQDRTYEDQLHEMESAYLPKLYPKTSTVWGELKERLPQAEITYAQGCELMGDDRSGFEEAVRLAREAEAAILVVGGKDGFGPPCTTGEGNDSSHIGLSGVQEELVQAIHAAGTPIVVVHMSARPLVSPWIAAHVPAIVEAWHPGESGGRAIVDVLVGDYNPGGKLPVTVPRSVGQVPVYYAHRNGSGYEGRHMRMFVSEQGYVNESLQPLYPFGHGLSYTKFTYSDFEISERRVTTDQSVTISCRVTNDGPRDGDEVVQVYISDRWASVVRPVKELAGFKRIHLKRGEQKRVSFTVAMSQLCFLNKDMKWVVEPGEMSVIIGTSATDSRLEGTFEIVGDAAVVKDETKQFFAEVQVS